MKKTLIGTLLATSLLLVQACASSATSKTGSPADQPEPQIPPATETQVPDSPPPIVSTSLPAISSGGGSEPATLTSDPNAFFTGDVTLANQGQIINLQMGDSFLLNLGDDQYTWSVSVDNDSVLHLKMGVMVIKGAQGIYDALASGTATLTAQGDPLCRQSTPACAMPSILFTLTVVVK